jgi:hypothetical protein
MGTCASRAFSAPPNRATASGGTGARGSRSSASAVTPMACPSSIRASRRGSVDGGGAQELAGLAEEGADRLARLAGHSDSAASRAASSSAVRAPMISSNSPSITRSILCRVRPMRWSVTRPCGKL